MQPNRNIIRHRNRLFIIPASFLGAFIMMLLWIGLLTIMRKDTAEIALAVGGGNGVITHTLTTDFTRTCTVLTGVQGVPSFVNTSATTGDNGEVRLTAPFEDFFSASSLNESLWLEGPANPWYYEPVEFISGNLVLWGNYVRSIQPFSEPRRFFEARTQNAASGVVTAANTDQGFYRINPPLTYTDTIPNTESIRLFVSENGGSNNMYVRARNGNSEVEWLDDYLAPAPIMTEYHVYRIEWDTTQTRYYVDNVLRSTLPIDASTLPGYAFLYHQDPISGTAPMFVDWVRAGVYPASGSYVSCVQDAGGTVNFSSVEAVTSIPAGSGLTIETRTSNNGLSWSDWAVATGGVISNPSGRYLQYRLNFTSNNLASAEVSQLRFNYYGPYTLLVSPSSVTLDPGLTQAFTVQAFDENVRPFTNLDFTWDVVAGGGTISTNGLFTAGVTSGTFNNTVRASTALVGGGSVSGFATVTVRGIDPIADAGGPYTGSETGLIYLVGTGSDPNGETVTFAWDLDNDGLYDDSTLQNPSTSFPDNGTYTVGLRVTNQSGRSSTDTASITVTNLNPTIVSVTGTAAINEGAGTLLTITATDPAGVNDPLSYSFDCQNDGTYEIVPQASNQATCTYGDNGTFTVNVQVTDGDGGEDTDTSFVVIVTNVAPTIVSVTGTAAINEGAGTLLTVTATDPAGVNDPLSYSFDCQNDGTYEIVPQASNQATCTYGDNGTFTVNVQVTDGDGGTDTDTSFVVTVTNVAPVISMVANNGPVNEGSPVMVTVTASDAAGANDPLTYQFDCNNDGTYDLSQSSNIGNCTIYDQGVHPVVVRVNDGDGGVDTETTSVTVANVAPTIVSVTTNSPVPPINPVTITITATDPAGTSDPLVYSFDCNNDSVYEVGPQSSNIGQCPILPVGAYVIQFKVDDQDGGVVINSTMVVVNWAQKLYLPFITKQ
jgi:hypothetical protein